LHGRKTSPSAGGAMNAQPKPRGKQTWHKKRD
jgi:hypothetical protein